MKVNDKIYTPRFCTVTIEKIFENRNEAFTEGYREPTHYHKDGYTILGKPTSVGKFGVETMSFVGVKE